MSERAIVSHQQNLFAATTSSPSSSGVAVVVGQRPGLTDHSVRTLLQSRPNSSSSEARRHGFDARRHSTLLLSALRESPTVVSAADAALLPSVDEETRQQLCHLEDATSSFYDLTSASDVTDGSDITESDVINSNVIASVDIAADSDVTGFDVMNLDVSDAADVTIDSDVTHSDVTCSDVMDGGSVSVRLEHKELWDRFNALGTEMVITKSGR